MDTDVNQPQSQMPVTSTKTPKPKKKGKSKRRVIIIVIAILVIALLVSGYYAYNMVYGNPYKHLRGEKGVDSSGLEVSDKELYQADNLISSGDLDGAKRIYDSRISDAKGDENKATEYVNAANAFFSLGQDTKEKTKSLEYALTYGLKGEQLYPSVQSAAVLSLIYAATGDKEQTANYTAKIDERIDRHDEKSKER